MVADHVNAPAAVGIGILVCQSLSDGRHLGLRLFDGNAWLQSPYRKQVTISSISLGGINRQGRPYLGNGNWELALNRELKLSRHNSDHHIQSAIEGEGFAEKIWVAAEA